MPPQASEKRADQDFLNTVMDDTDAIDFELIEQFFFAYRDFVSDPDAILSHIGFGRAHHRVIHFVNREPGMTVAALLETLQITKQSLSRVLKELIDSGYIRQMAGPRDRRQKRLYVTLKGRELALALAEPQSRRIKRAFGDMGPEIRQGIVRFLAGMQNSREASDS